MVTFTKLDNGIHGLYELVYEFSRDFILITKSETVFYELFDEFSRDFILIAKSETVSYELFDEFSRDFILITKSETVFYDTKIAISWTSTAWTAIVYDSLTLSHVSALDGLHPQ